MNRYYVIFFLGLNACTQLESKQVLPENIVIPVPCRIPKIAEPDWNINHIAKQSSDVEKLRAILADLDLYKGYVAQLKAANNICS